MLEFIKAIFSKKEDDEKEINSIALQNPQGQHLGFILFRPSFSGNEGNCVFMALPAKPSMLKSSEGKHLVELKQNGEHSWQRAGSEVLISHDGEALVNLRDNGVVSHLPTKTKLGYWLIASCD